MLQIDCAKPLQAHRPALDTHGMRQMNPNKVTFISRLWSAQVCRDLVALEPSADPQVAALQVRARALLTKSRSEKQFPTVEAVVRRAVAVVPGPSSDAPPAHHLSHCEAREQDPGDIPLPLVRPRRHTLAGVAFGPPPFLRRRKMGMWVVWMQSL